MINRQANFDSALSESRDVTTPDSSSSIPSHDAPRGVPGDFGHFDCEVDFTGLESTPHPQPLSPIDVERVAPKDATQSGARGAQRTDVPATDVDYQVAQELAQVCEQFLRLTDAKAEGGGHSLRVAASILGKSVSFFSGKESMYARWQRGGVEGLLQRRGASGAKPGDLTAWIESLPWFIPAANLFYLICNRTSDSGSMPEAVRRTLSLPAVPVGWKESDKLRLLRALKLDAMPACPPELREECLAREKKGMELVPERIAKQIRLKPSTVRQYRNPREASLDLLSTPGGMRLFALPDGTRRLARAGEIIEADDATVNFPVCVPWERDGSDDPCVQKFGVKVSRFQWLVSICAGTSFVTGFSYTARPRSSYRAEDIVSLMRIVTRQHGIPKTWRFERGAWESNLVKSAVSGMGSKLDTVYSPHQKPFIEGLFNTLWTKLSVHFPGGHVGRSQGEEREANLLLAACKAGHKDPRKYFPMLTTAIAAFNEVIAEKNGTRVNSKHHGSWIPEERWERELAIPRMDAASDWMFAPFMRTWTVHGMLVGGRVPIFEGVSVPFDFSAPWLVQYDGVKVRCHFDPQDPRCSAMLVLAENFGDERAGKILGSAGQVNDAAGYIRLVMGWGEDPAMAGVIARQKAAAGLRREVRAVLPRGQRGATASEERDGVGKVTKIEGSGITIQDKSPEPQRAPAEDPETIARRTADLATREREANEFMDKNALDFI